MVMHSHYLVNAKALQVGRALGYEREHGVTSTGPDLAS
jgi:hypothetical protein